MDELPRASELRSRLIDAGFLVPTSVDGVYLRSRGFEELIRGVERVASAAGAGAEIPMLYLPAVMPREAFEHTEYLRSFPDLIGSIDIFVGSERDHAAMLSVAEAGGDWSQSLVPAEVVLSSAACHSLYPILRGTVPEGGRQIECQGPVFRHEPSLDPTRMQFFRMHEFVYVGEADGAVAHRDLWLERGLEVLSGFGLDVEAVVANDPFFGRAGRILASGQRESALKFEIVAPITADRQVPIASANCHQGHFGALFGIETAAREVAHSACFGFGLERIALALLTRHGLELDRWPANVRSQLDR
jgi:seryl-tRNA synthetase